MCSYLQGGPEITEAEDQEDYKAEEDDAESEDVEVGWLPGQVQDMALV